MSLFIWPRVSSIRVIPGWLLILAPWAVRLMSAIRCSDEVLDWIYGELPQLKAFIYLISEHPDFSTLLCMSLGLAWIYFLGFRPRFPFRHVEYCYGIDDLEDKYPFADLVKENEVWAYWLSGEGVLSEL